VIVDRRDVLISDIAAEDALDRVRLFSVSSISTATTSPRPRLTSAKSGLWSASCPSRWAPMIADAVGSPAAFSAARCSRSLRSCSPTSSGSSSAAKAADAIM
jgi:hypothetical protein